MKFSTSILVISLGLLALSNVARAESKVIERGACTTADEKAECSQQCTEGALQPMCVSDTCFCTNVGVGDCSENNNKGCKAICRTLGLETTGCSDDECVCD
ncbi:hypothetical protein PHYBLDRAFT_59009 [Phycomyces blakesleeanus NRRL 1555(-)]|uniref:Secreted protein n=2 Tax=Phycomyces blakesleeanus TaxID=4837 RepID=A0A162YD54_PHYB8|nr:hypothetical protein PHYBLDRAFT_59009 [Phycomyces blakesleeanus NRRL 1555(-)]OAD79965.1 hypothetical protein PHYBLDRAFT_59009 [Phycomyces blakesleeanus NRRL 1555(-)]|eukprot:XP_018298005.1 hypothetical protein PHYBLDRAFT_59009 [Phycomyces blakesleeanus NRRL 1555(-)]